MRKDEAAQGRISVDQALELIACNVVPLAPQLLDVDASIVGAVAAKPAFAVFSSPRFNCSAMDGYAVRSDDLARAQTSAFVKLALVADVPAECSPPSLPVGHAAPISTGARIPAGADAVIVHERCTQEGGVVLVPATSDIRPGLNIRRGGEDVTAGAIVLGAGRSLRPDAIGALRAAGVGDLWCRKPPRVVIMPTGSELALDMSDPSARCDSNGPMIAAACRLLGMPCHLHGTIPDTVNGVRAAFDLASEGPAEMILSIGGVSNGRHDLVRLALEQMGAEILFHGLAMRPGKPLLFALLPDGRPFFGLPGNPLAALVGFRFFVAAAARRLMGSAPELGSPLAEPPPGREGITLFLRGRRTPSGVVPLENQRSHMMSSLINADCWIRADLAEGNARAVVFPLYDGLG